MPAGCLPGGPASRLGASGAIPRHTTPHDLLALRHALTPRRVRLDPGRDAGHALRSGLATAAAQAGVRERAILAQTGHRALTMVRRSSREGSLFRDNAAAAVGL